jgi:hypothetical protein
VVGELRTPAFARVCARGMLMGTCAVPRSRAWLAS